jgi:hypothetical protein
MNRVGENFDPVNGLDGSGFQNSLRRIRQASSENAGQPNGQDLSEALGHTEDGLRGMVQRQAPGQLPMYDAANEANRNVSVLRDAVNAARSGTITGEPGVFSAAQLSNAAQSNARRYGDAHGTTNQPFFDLTRAGQKVLPSNVPDSGSAGRLAMFAIPSMLAGGGIGASNSDNAVSGGATGAGISTAAMAAILAAGGSKVGQHALTAALLDRPDIAVHLGNQIYNRGAPVAGMFGAGAAAAMLPGR